MQNSTQKSQERLKQMVKSSYSVNNYHNYSEQKLAFKQDSFDCDTIQPLSKLLNLTLTSNSEDKSPFRKQRNTFNSTSQVISTINENSCNKGDSQNFTQQKTLQFQQIDYENGIYYGQTSNHSPFGEGGFFWDNGCFYYGKLHIILTKNKNNVQFKKGQWRDGQMHGCGLFIFKTGSVLRGNFKKGKVHGLAELSFFSSFEKQILNGFWIDGQFEGISPAKFYQNGISQFQERNFLNDISEQSQRFFDGDYLNENYDIQRDSFKKQQQQFQVNPYYYDNELKKKLFNYVACENSIDVGEKKNNLLNGLAIKFYFDGKIEFGSYKKGLLEGRGKILFKSGDIYDGYFINSAFQGPGIYFNNQDKVWAYGAFSKNKIMYLQSQDNSYPPPALCNLCYQNYKENITIDDLRQKDENFDCNDRLIGDTQMRERNIIFDLVLDEQMQRKANGEYVKIESQISCQTQQQTQTEENQNISLYQGTGSPFQIPKEDQNKQNFSPLIQSENSTSQFGLRKTADFGNTIKNLQSIFQSQYHQEMETIKENQYSCNNFSYEADRKSYQEIEIEKQLEIDDVEKAINNHSFLPTNQTATALTPRSQNLLSARFITSIAGDNSQINENMECPLECTPKYYGISQETYQIIQELEKQEVLQKQRDRSTEKITKIKALINNYLCKPNISLTPTQNQRLSNDLTPNSKKNHTLTKTVSKVNNENINPLQRRTPSMGKNSSSRNLFSTTTNNQNSLNKKHGRESFSKQSFSQQNQQSYSNKKKYSYTNCLSMVQNHFNTIGMNNILSSNQNTINKSKQNGNIPYNPNNTSKSPNRLTERNKQQKSHMMDKQNQNKMTSEKQLNKATQQQQSNRFPSYQVKQNHQLQNAQTKSRIKNYSQQYEPQNRMKVSSPDQKQKAQFSQLYHKNLFDNNTPIHSPQKPIFSNSIQSTMNAKNNASNDLQKHFYFTQSCRNHKRNVSSINFSTSNVSQNQSRQKCGTTLMQTKRSFYPLNINIC